MARTSGAATEMLASAEFTHGPSDVHYRIYSEGGQAWLSFERPGDPSVHGKKRLLYYIGSGQRGRTYLFETDGFLFESPVNWYAAAQMWDVTPGYGAAREIPLNLPVYTSCLNCHTSGMQPPVNGTANRYPQPAFTQTGVACERCHGPGAAHVNGGPIVNPAKLTPVRRDEICMQCHMEGKAAIERKGHHRYEFRPGDTLGDYIRYFVLAAAPDAGLGALSQVEALSQSECKKKSGDVMSCTSCHNPHESPTAENRVAYYREKCLACHGAAIGARHHANQPDCTECHMPSLRTTDVAHTQVTDHRIPRRPRVSPRLLQEGTTLRSTPRLMPFPASQSVDPRDLALAWTSLAKSGRSADETQERHLLLAALKRTPDDPELLSALGYFEQKRGATDEARQLYRKALRLTPESIVAATNLGVIEAQAGRVIEAVKLWQDAFKRAPDRSSIGMNIARVYCQAGKIDEARDYVLRVLEFSLDRDPAKKMLRELGGSPANCGP
jgi:predicted CXXCH cytochrome family protein